MLVLALANQIRTLFFLCLPATRLGARRHCPFLNPNRSTFLFPPVQESPDHSASFGHGGFPQGRFEVGFPLPLGCFAVQPRRCGCPRLSLPSAPCCSRRRFPLSVFRLSTFFISRIREVFPAFFAFLSRVVLKFGGVVQSSFLFFAQCGVRPPLPTRSGQELLATCLLVNLTSGLWLLFT